MAKDLELATPTEGYSTMNGTELKYILCLMNVCARPRDLQVDTMSRQLYPHAIRVEAAPTRRLERQAGSCQLRDT